MMLVLRSTDNDRVKRWAKLGTDGRLRRRERCALIEGLHVVSDWVALRGAPLALLVREDHAARPEIGALIARCGGSAVMMTSRVLERMVGTGVTASVAAEIAIPDDPVSLRSVDRCVFLEGVQDPGNTGTILRSAAAFGCSAAVLTEDCADPWSLKVVRAASGAHARIAIAVTAALESSIDAFGGTVLCAMPRAGVPLQSADLRGRIGWVFGSEGVGVSGGVRARAAAGVSIPMPGGAESLNVAAAAAVCLYETVRQNEAAER